VDKFYVVLSPHAVADLDSFSDTVCIKIAKAIKALEESPFPRGKLIKKIKGKSFNYYRLRVDKYRVFYMIQSGKVVVLKILSKKNADRFISNLN
jgi:mRNA interferase RelE/StbE